MIQPGDNFSARLKSFDAYRTQAQRRGYIRAWAHIVYAVVWTSFCAWLFSGWLS